MAQPHLCGEESPKPTGRGGGEPNETETGWELGVGVDELAESGSQSCAQVPGSEGLSTSPLTQGLQLARA